jgi:ABC-type Na+ efflux pump permease subunit
MSQTVIHCFNLVMSMQSVLIQVLLLHSMGYNFTMLKKIGVGFLLAALSMVVAGMLGLACDICDIY